MCIRDRVLEVKAQVKSTAKSIVDEAKAKGRAALYRVSEFLEIKKRLLDIRENVRGAIKTTDKDIAKTALLAKGFLSLIHICLVEYSIRSGYVKISYKNRNGVRKEGALDWRELYEILSYMVKQPFYCGEDQKKYYQETKQKADRDKMNPVHKRFFDIEDSVKANRLETRERAIANGWNTKIDENGHVVSDDTVQKKHNFHYNLWEMEKGGAKTRYQWNIDAIRTLKQIESENRLATPEEQKILSKFVGWGGLSQAFDEENAGWSKEYAELKELLSDEEYSAARATVNNGTHFTEMDKVLVQMENDYANQEKWQNYAENNDRATFMLLFEKDFPNMAADRYEQNDQFFRKLFDDPDMMKQVMETVGSVLYERLKKKYIFDPKSGVIEEATPETYVEDTYLTEK